MVVLTSITSLQCTDVPHDRGNLVQLALALHQALNHCLQMSSQLSNTTSTTPPSLTAEYLAKLQTLQSDNNSIQE